MLVRVRSKDGNFRFELNPTDDASVLLDKILETAKDADPGSVTVSQQPRGGETSLKLLTGRSLSNLGLKHADLLFVAYQTLDVPSSSSSAPKPSTAPGVSSSVISEPNSTAKRPWESVVEDSVDVYWRQRDGKIPRSRDPKFCRHGPNGMCDYCMPLEPYDATYQASHSIKHLSFHAHLRQLAPQQFSSTSAPQTTGGATPSTALPPLNPLSYKVRTPCPSESHPPYPAGICTACQPSAITLSRQLFRSTDHVEIASPSIIDTFLGSWRKTGRQRFGWLLGSYKPYEEVPMGVKAVVEAIHEPPQDGELDGLSLSLPWEDEERVEELASAAGLAIVGMIYTDLTPNPDDKTKTLCKRHKDSFFLSSLETVFAAREQLKRPMKTKSSPTGNYSSRLVTAVLSGTSDGGIDLACYMASEQGCAMVDADMIEPTVEAGMVRIKLENEGEGRYVPDVFYTFKNEYGIQVKQSAKPCFPVEYLLVNVTHGFPTVPSPIFRTTTPFAVENRPFTDVQDSRRVFSEINQLGAQKLHKSSKSGSPEQSKLRRKIATFLSDWHLIAFLPQVGVLSEDDVKLIARIATAPQLDDPALFDQLLSSDGWQTLLTIAQETAEPARPSAPAPGGGVGDDGFEIPPEVYDDAGGSGGSGIVTCPHCTFENPSGRTDCEVCGLPLA